MSEHPYIANFNSAISYLKIGQNEHAKESIRRALSQVPDDAKRGDNPVYLKILALSARFAIEEKDYDAANIYISEGIALKDDHADLLFLKALIMMDHRRYDEMFAELIKYLLSCGAGDAKNYDYDFVNTAALQEAMEKLLPTAYENALDHASLRNVVERLSDVSGNEYLKRAHEIMQSIDKTH